MAATSSSDFWSNLRETVTGLAVDYARARYVDVEQQGDDRNIPDNADLRYWGFGDKNGTGLVTAPGGLPLAGWAMIAAAIVGGVYLLRKL